MEGDQMKTTRLKRGYRVKLTDKEFDALTILLMLGAADVDDIETWTDDAAVRTAITGLIERGLALDEDRRCG
jgi:hypothetical protein